jgi:hypothetical protein
METVADRVRRHAADVGDLAVVEARDFAQQEHLAIVVGEPAERGPDSEREREVDERRGLVHRLHRGSAMRGPPDMVTRQVSRDLEHPRALAAVASILCAQRAQEDVLRQILRGGGIASQPPEEPVDGQAVLREQGFDEQVVQGVSCC